MCISNSLATKKTERVARKNRKYANMVRNIHLLFRNISTFVILIVLNSALNR